MPRLADRRAHDDAAQAGFLDPLMLPDALTADARAWLTAHHPGASGQDVACFLLALGNAPSYTRTFREALEVETVRFPAITGPSIFREGVAIGERLLNAWMLQSPPAREHVTATPTVADAIRRVAAAIADILDEEDACDALLARAIAEPYVAW